MKRILWPAVLPMATSTIALAEHDAYKLKHHRPTSSDLKKDLEDVKKDRLDILKDRQDIARDQAKLRWDLIHNPGAVARGTGPTCANYNDLRKDVLDLQKDLADIREDREEEEIHFDGER